MRDLRVLPSALDVAAGAAELVARIAAEATADGRFTIALSGGSTPRALYELLASPDQAGRVSWERWHVFWGDERLVPPDDPMSNYRMAKEALLGRVPIPAEQLHRIRGEADPELAASEYEELMRETFDPGVPAFDLILLGLGDDGHTASLFPGTEALNERRRLVAANRVPQLDTTRITFTLPLINAARHIVFIVAGGSKAAALRSVLEPARDGPPPPAASVMPERGDLCWIADSDAVASLHRTA